MDERLEFLIRRVISGSYTPARPCIKDVIDKIEVLWIGTTILSAFYRLKGEKVTYGILDTPFVSGMHVNVTRGHLIQLRKEFPEITKEEVVEAVRKCNVSDL